MLSTSKDLELLKQTIELSRESKTDGNLPFACILADSNGHILLKAKNSIITSGNRMGHAEMNLILDAVEKYQFHEMNSFTIYTSSEPCPMCASSIYWAGIRRLIYGLSLARKNELIAPKDDAPGMFLPCRDVLKAANHPMEIHGPLLEEDAAKIFTD